MFYKLCLAIAFTLATLTAGIVPCDARTRVAMARNHKRRTKSIKKEKIPLNDLLGQIKEAEIRGDRKAQLALYKKVCKDYSSSEEAVEAYYARGVLYERNHQFTTAIKMFTKIVRRHPESLRFTQAIEYYFQIAKKLQEGVRPRYFGTIPGLRDYESAIKNYELVVKYAPYSCYAPKALIEIANLHLRAKRYDSAIDALDRLIDIYPDSVEVPYAYLKNAEIYSGLVKGDEYNQGGAVAALRCYNDFCSLFPYHGEVPLAMNRMKDLTESIVRSKIALGDFYFNARRNDKAAKILYRSAIDYAPYAPEAEVAQERIQRIIDGAQPKSTPIDFLFPHYKTQDNDEFVYAATVEDRIMDQKDGRRDPTDKASVTPFVKAENIHSSLNEG
ncbi:MAG: tetratricopeptide repeat protein [Puniceicoccales bacterium]|jgi:outer membrane protein assembly factor BamD|nr:tetratricopeptide repeat protein [Puniceicoccales bacterium]